jgi:transposase
MAQAMSKSTREAPVFVDAGYDGRRAQTVFRRHDRTDAERFAALPKRWVVERTHAWNERARCLLTQHDRLNSVCEP